MTLKWTGERFLPWIREHSTIAYEHLHRYAYAALLVRGKRVLDLACGEGYGSRMLAGAAESVVGVDIDEGAIRHASEKYGSPAVQFVHGSIAAVPVQEDHSFDVIVCFEAIEHIEDHDALLGEVRRLLKPDGTFVVSTPNKAIYHDEAREENPFHVKELYFEDFQALLARHFGNVQFLGQRIHPSSSIWRIGTASANGFHEFVLERDSKSDFEFIDAAQRVPLYFIAIASNATLTIPLPASTLVDQSDSLIKEKEAATRWREEQVKQRDEGIESLKDALKWRERQLDDLGKVLEATQTHAQALEKSVISQDEALKWRAHQVGDLEIAKDYWERQSTTLNEQLQTTQRQLSEASSTLTGIYASRGWKLITKLKRIRDAVTGRGKPHA